MDRLKRYYLYLRFGQVMIFPILSFSNFMMIAYLALDGFVPMRYLIPFLIVACIGSMIIIGRIFKNKQLSTDQNTVFEQSPHLIKTLRMILESDEGERKEWVSRLRVLENNI